MKLKVAVGKKTEAQDNQRLEELDDSSKDRIADTEVSACLFTEQLHVWSVRSAETRDDKVLVFYLQNN